jgi:RNA polymerase sigma-32 factor
MDTLGSGENIKETVIEEGQAEVPRKRLVDFKKLLTQKQCFILDNRIMAEDPLTLAEIGKRVNASRESIRQAQVKLSRKLVRNLRSVEIRPSM